MTPTTLALGAAGCLAVVVAVWVALSPSGPTGLDRLGALAGADPEARPEQAQPDRGGLRRRLHLRVGSRLERSDRAAQMAERLAMANVRLRPVEWLFVVVAGSCVIAALLVLRFGSPLLAPVALLLGWLLGEAVLRVRTGQRRRAFDKQLAPTILSLSSGLKAGYTFLQAVDLVARNSPAPMGNELSRIVRETQLGVPQVEALAHMNARNGSDDLKLMLTAVQIQSQVGGNLAQILDTIEFTIRERIRIKGEIKTVTAQARMSGYILIALPFALGAILSLVAPTYFTPMLQQTAGLIMLGVGGGFLLAGYLIIRKIVNIRV